jgi:hypothetical protein
VISSLNRLKSRGPINSTLAIWEETPCGSGKGEQALTWNEAKCGGSVDITNFSSAFCSYKEQPCL